MIRSLSYQRHTLHDKYETIKILMPLTMTANMYVLYHVSYVDNDDDDPKLMWKANET